MQETQVRSLGWEDPLEKEMATHSSILAWKIPWTEDPGRLQSMDKESDTTERLHFHFQQAYSKGPLSKPCMNCTGNFSSITECHLLIITCASGFVF